MSEQEAAPQDYPENWDDHAKATAEGERNIKLKDGQSVSFHIVSGPLTFRELYVETGEMAQNGKPKKKRYAVPFGVNIPGHKFKVKYIIEVILTDGPAKGAHKLLEFGKSIADSLEAIKLGKWGSTRKCDIAVKRNGSGQFDTEYIVTAEPGTIPETGNPVEFNLVSEVRYSTADELKTLPSPTATPVGDTKVKVSDKQVDFIDGLCKSKELTVKALKGILERKFSKGDLSELTSTEASTLIETLQGM